MSISWTYATLRTALQEWMEDGFSDYTDQLDNIIALAESRCIRDLDLELFDQVDGTSSTTTSGTATIDMADVGEGTFVLRELWVNGVFCEPKSESYVYHYGDVASSGQPLYWCQVQDSTIRIAPTPDATYSTRQILLRRPTGLSSTQNSTFISKHAGDLLFAACKAQSESFDKAPEDQAVAEAEYQALLAPTRNELRPLARKGYP